MACGNDLVEDLVDGWMDEVDGWMDEVMGGWMKQ